MRTPVENIFAQVLIASAALIIGLPLPAVCSDIDSRMKAAQPVYNKQEWVQAAALYKSICADLEADSKARGRPDDRMHWTTYFYGMCLLNQNKFREAEPVFKRVLDLRTRMLPPISNEIGDGYQAMGDVCVGLKRLKDAETNYRQAMAFRESLEKADHNLGKTYQRLAEVLLQTNRAIEAENYLVRAMLLQRQPLDRIQTLKALAEVSAKLKKPKQAEDYRKQAIDIEAKLKEWQARKSKMMQKAK